MIERGNNLEEFLAGTNRPDEYRVVYEVYLEIMKKN
jgi:hypothetical protein